MVTPLPTHPGRSQTQAARVHKTSQARFVLPQGSPPSERSPDLPGDLATFRWAVTPEAAQSELDWFCEHALPAFGTYQDALAEESPWLFHGLISMYLNCGLLEPLTVCEQVESAYR